MAKKGKLESVPEPVEETEEAGTYGVENREPNELHEAFAAWVQEEIGEKVSPRAAQISWSMRNAFRKSEAYVPFRNAKEQRAAAKEAGDDEDTEDTPKPKGKAAKAAKAAAEPAETPPAKAAAKPARARGKAAKPATAAAPF